MIVIVFSVSMFLSAALLFLVEPMLAKMMLPMLGGTPAVWNTCLVFFQAVLLAGYLYAYAAMKWLGRRTQIAVHLCLVVLPLAIVGLMPLHLHAGWVPPAESNPALWILMMLLIAVGLPFFALTSSTPIMQRWFSESGHPYADDPYFLYAASNAGSLVGLLAYPLLLEPLLPLSDQSHLWSLGYMLFVAMTAACALLVGGRRRARENPQPDTDEEIVVAGAWKERLRWIALAFVPSSLMLGVTTALTTDVPAIPLFWVLPLALYLVSFVLVFARRPLIPHRWLAWWLPLIMLLALFPVVSRFKFSIALLMSVYLLMLFCVAMVCHGDLAQNRPPVGRLTEFYLLISVGGVLGGIFNSLVAPVVFHSAIEFPLVIILAALLQRPEAVDKPAGNGEVGARLKDWLFPLALGLCMTALILGVEHAGMKPGFLAILLFFAYSMLACWSFRRRPLRFALGIAAMLLASSLYTGSFGRVLNTERSFFGVSRVTNSPDGRYRYMIHGGTLHGIQSLDATRSREPLAYYTATGPAGEIFRAAQARTPNGDWAIVGLGAGAMACYLQPGQTLTYYEIDPLVVRLAKNPRYFTFMEQCAPQARIVLGDARLKLQDAPDAHYGLIVLDAFSGDSIPMHLLTREALAMYQRKLAPGGLIAFHISSNYLRLWPTLGDLAADAHLVCIFDNDTDVSQAEMDQGKTASVWVVMARSEADVAALLAGKVSSAKWVPLHARAGSKVWSDEYSNMLGLIKWMGN
jgi:hypothetical protein